MGTTPIVARAALHRWEEPCLSGTRGSGTVFFCGCNLGCRFCQNRVISTRSGAAVGRPVTVDGLVRLYDKLAALGAHNINLVTPTHYIRAVAESLSRWEKKCPVVYNTGGYELTETVALLRGKVDVYLPDMKYADASLAARFCGAPDYPTVAAAAIRAMAEQTGDPVFDERGILLRGTVIRHLVLPGFLENTFDVIDWVVDTFGRTGRVLFSLMSQYTPMPGAEPDRRLTPDEYERVAAYMDARGLRIGFMQELSSAQEEYIPPFDRTGVEEE